MFETISEKLNNVLSKIGQKGRLREDDIEKALKEIRIALLEADVNFKVVKTFINRVKERSLDSEVLKSFSSGQQVIKITKEELTVILGGAVSKIQRSSEKTSVILVLGLNGSGKTTTTAKMSNYFKIAGQTSLMVAADLRRPAAIDQLVTLGKSIEIDVYNDPEAKDPVSVAKSTVILGLNLFWVYQIASANTSRPSASVFNTSMVWPDIEVTISPGLWAFPEGIFSTKPTMPTALTLAFR